MSTVSPTPPPPAPTNRAPAAPPTPTAVDESAALDTSGPPASPTPSHGLLVNGGFEAQEEGRPVGWRTQGGVLLQTDEHVRTGRFAGGFWSATESTKWAYQTVGVTPAAWYEMGAHIYHDDPRVGAALLRISWYASADGSGQAVATVDSTAVLAEAEGRWRYLTTGPVLAPPGVHSAKARVLLRPRSAVSAAIYIDDVTFRPAAEPPVEPAPQEESGAAAGGTSSRSSSRPGDGSGGRRSSEVIGALRSAAAAPSTPMPTPVIRRGSRLAAEEDAPLSGDGLLWWPWALAGGVLAAGGAGWAVYRWGRQKRAAF